MQNKIHRYQIIRFRHWRPQDNAILAKRSLKEWEVECKDFDYLYKRDWLGDRVMPEGVIYSMFNEDTHMTKEIIGKPVEAFFSAGGGQSDATPCLLNLVTWKDGKYYLYRMANFYHNGADTGVTKAMSEYAKEIKHFKDDVTKNGHGYLSIRNSFSIQPASH